MADGFAQVLASAEARDDGFAIDIPASWHQGRTAYGGFSAALSLRAALRAGGDVPPLRSALVSFVGPLAGSVEVDARVLRRGRNATWVSSEVRRRGEVGLSGSFAFMGPVQSMLQLDDRPAPDGVIAPEQALAFAMRYSPAFHQNHFEARFALPRDAAKRADVCWWVRLREREGIDPATELLLIADALPPGVLPLLHPGAPVSSMTWQANLLTSAPATRDGWWLLRSTADYAQGGCSSQRMAIWNADGAPMMAGMQSVAVFG